MIKHSTSTFLNHFDPQYRKEISDLLVVSLSYLQDNENECLVSFHNILNENVTINPSADEERDNNEVAQTNTGGWFSNMFSGSAEAELKPLHQGTSTSKQLFLGYIQLVGYVVCNYKFDLNDGNTIDMGNTTIGWWNDKDYVSMYNNDDTEPGQEELEDGMTTENILDQVPFIALSIKDRMIVGGKIGGLNDLVVSTGDAREELMIDNSKRYFLHDLVYGFNSLQAPNQLNFQENGEIKNQLSISEITESILPFYSTSQSLLFSDLTLKGGETKTFHIKFPKLNDVPPSYNVRLTGLVADQGLVSIRYLLVVGTLDIQDGGNIQSSTVYFPYEKTQTYVGNEEYLQPDYLQRVVVDHKWNTVIVNSGEDLENIETNENQEEQASVDRSSFLDDLQQLVESDLYTMPKISTKERRRSSLSITTHENNTNGNHHVRDDGLIAQLPKNQKTQYQIRLNNHPLCTLSVSKPFYHIGEDISFVIDMNNEDLSSSIRIAGVIIHLEALEKFPYMTKNLQDKAFNNIYKVGPSMKLNAFAPAIFNQENTQISGFVNIPQHLTPQFQSSRLMDLLYFLVFKFHLNEFETSVVEDGTNGEEEELNPQESAQPLVSNNSHGQSKGVDDVAPFEKFRKYQVDNNGREFTFRLPVVIV